MRRRPASMALLMALLSGMALAVSAEPKAYPSAELVEPLSVGTAVPSVSVQRVSGESVDLASLVAERGALQVFYRGGW